MAAGDRYDLVVVGAGPAGCATAIEATRRGLSVTVVDKATFPRDKTCGDGLTTNALRLLEQLGLSRAALSGDGGYQRVDDVVLVAPGGRAVELPLPQGRGDFAAVVSRLCLDTALLEVARDAGAHVFTGEAVATVDASSAADASGVTITGEGGSTWRAGWVVAADGHWSPTRRHVQPHTPRDLGAWHAARQYFTDAGDGRLWVLFEEDLLPGYAWVFPLPGGHANVGYGVLRADARRGRDLKELWRDLLERPHIRRILGSRAQPVGNVRAWPIPTDYDSAALHHGRVLFVGDAARVVDPMTGEGIAQAVETGMLAAAAVAGGGRTDDVAERYRTAVDRALGRDLRFATRLQRVLASPRGARAALRIVDTNAWTRRNFARWMFEDYPRATIFTPDRWRRGRFHDEGAYNAVAARM
jgi:geranylgeranyl reductase family protein